MDNLRLAVIIFLLLMNPGCRTHDEEKLLAEQATSAQRFSKQIQAMKVIASMSDQNENTQSVLYGNDSAYENARSRLGAAGEPVFILVKLKSQEDASWFGGIIPSKILSLEVLEHDSNGASGSGFKYSLYKGKNLEIEKNVSDAAIDERKHFISSIKASVMP